MKKEDLFKKIMSYKKLSKYACKDSSALLLKEEDNNDIRPRFFRDADRIIYSLSFTRYIDKTQVHTLSNNDNISKRIIHVQFVSKIARTIGRCLMLNEDLIEAASLGHDLGHPPFGHPGEAILNKISLENNEGIFAHNIQSVRTLMNLEDNGNGRNISIQVMDAILCHNGEALEGKYTYIDKNKEQFLDEYNSCYNDKEKLKTIKPMTLEACVVRISDIVAYAGKDIEDAMRLNIIKKEDIPSSITSVLGSNNREIINVLVKDIINSSYNKPYITMSKKVNKALNELIKFNYKNIYLIVSNKDKLTEYEKIYRVLFSYYLDILNNKDYNNDIYTIFINNMTDDYKKNTNNVRIVIDYISGMTDNYFMRQYKKIVI